MTFTPEHFLIGVPILTLPELLLDRSMNALTRWQLLQKMRDHISVRVRPGSGQNCQVRNASNM